jgi:predicted small secreted protein
MKVKEISVGKEMKIGLPSFSNITASCYMTVEVGENEQIDWDKIWDEVNQQLYIQADNVDGSWIQTKEYKNFFKSSIKTNKQEVK